MCPDAGSVHMPAVSFATPENRRSQTPTNRESLNSPSRKQALNLRNSREPNSRRAFRRIRSPSASWNPSRRTLGEKGESQSEFETCRAGRVIVTSIHEQSRVV